MENPYFINTVATPLVTCLQEVSELKPHDPIEWIAKWLYKYVDNELYILEKVQFLEVMEEQQELLRRQRKCQAARRRCLTSKILGMKVMTGEIDEETARQMSFLANAKLSMAMDGSFGLDADMGAGMGSIFGAGMGSIFGAGMGAGMGSIFGAGMAAGMGAGKDSIYGPGMAAGMGAGKDSIYGPGMAAGMDAGKESIFGPGMGVGKSSFLGAGMGAAVGPSPKLSPKPPKKFSTTGKEDETDEGPCKATWKLNCQWGLICEHPVLGDIEPRPPLVYPETPEWWERKKYIKEALYDPEIYSRDNDDMYPGWKDMDHMTYKDFVHEGPWLSEGALRNMQPSLQDLYKMQQKFVKHTHKKSEDEPTLP